MFKIINNCGTIDENDDKLYDFTSFIQEIYMDTSKNKKYYCIEVDGI